MPDSAYVRNATDKTTTQTQSTRASSAIDFAATMQNIISKRQLEAMRGLLGI